MSPPSEYEVINLHPTKLSYKSIIPNFLSCPNALNVTVDGKYDWPYSDYHTKWGPCIPHRLRGQLKLYFSISLKN